MKNKQAETKLRSDIGLTRHLISGALCLAAISLICARASAQNLFASDGDSIDEFAPNGVRSTFASGLTGALAFDKAGNLFVADRGNGAIYKITPAGVRTTFASGLDLPTALAFDSAGNLFVANVSNSISGAIYKFTPAGGRTAFASGLTNPEAVAFDNASNLFVAASNGTSGTGAIYKFTSGGVESTFALGFSPFAPLAFDSAGNLFVSDFGGNIYKFTPSGVRSTFASGVSGFLAFGKPRPPAPTDFAPHSTPDSSSQAVRSPKNGHEPQRSLEPSVAIPFGRRASDPRAGLPKVQSDRARRVHRASTSDTIR